jgi:uncharacterized membrane protein YfhO
MAVDLNSLKTSDKGVLGAAIGVFIFSFFSSYVTVSFGGFSAGADAWHSYAVLALLLLFAAAAIVAIKAFDLVELPEIGVGWALITTACAALGAFLLILRALTYSGSGVSVGWSGYVLFILAIAETVFAAMAFRESGETTPWANRASGSSGSGTPPAPPPPPPA